MAVETISMSRSSTSEDPIGARAKRIPSGDIRPDDYPIITDEVKESVDLWIGHLITQIRREGGMEADIATQRVMFSGMSVDLQFAGQEIITKDTDKGLIVLASNADEVRLLLHELSAQAQENIVLMYPGRFYLPSLVEFGELVAEEDDGCPPDFSVQTLAK